MSNMIIYYVFVITGSSLKSSVSLVLHNPLMHDFFPFVFSLFSTPLEAFSNLTLERNRNVFICIRNDNVVWNWILHNLVFDKPFSQQLLFRITRCYPLFFSPSLLQNKAGYTATPVACGWAGVVNEVGYQIIWAGAARPKTAKTQNKPDRAMMCPGCVSACIDHVTNVWRDRWTNRRVKGLSKHVGWSFVSV